MVSYLNTKVCIEKEQNIQTTVYYKETDRQIYLHSKPEQPLCLKQSILFKSSIKTKMNMLYNSYIR